MVFYLSRFTCPNLPYLSVEVEQFVFQEVGVGGHEWAGKSGETDVTLIWARARLWKTTG